VGKGGKEPTIELCYANSAGAERSKISGPRGVADEGRLPASLSVEWRNTERRYGRSNKRANRFPDICNGVRGALMEISVLRRHLAMAERHVAMGEALLASQRARIDRMRDDGFDVGSAEALLKLMLATQALHVEDRDRLLDELADIPE
jgi:hypothetical protein